jgi:hypothetical protein
LDAAPASVIVPLKMRLDRLVERVEHEVLTLHARQSPSSPRTDFRELVRCGEELLFGEVLVDPESVERVAWS